MWHLARCGARPWRQRRHPQTRRRGDHMLSHESVGRSAKLGSQAARNWPFQAGDRVALAESMPYGACNVCRTEAYRFCQQTDPSVSRQPQFHGITPVDVPRPLWGAYSHDPYLGPW
jgi:threonine dehydrogenase-like Zn-dependent dehydrogenase